MRHVSGGYFTPKATLSLVIIVAVVWSVLAGCGGGPADNNGSAEGTAKETTTTGSSTTEATAPMTSDVLFAKLKPTDGLYASTGIRGQLVLDDEGCLRIKTRESKPGHVAIWPSDFGMEIDGDEVKVLDGGGDLIARVGERVELGGGESPAINRQNTVPRPLPNVRNGEEVAERCPGQYWLVAPPAPPHKTTTEATTPPASDVLFPQQKPSDGLPMSAGITGELVLDEEGCIRIDSGGALPDSLPLWPSYFELSARGDEIRILDGEGDFVARVGGEIDTGGGEMQHGETTPRETLRVLRRGVGEDMARELRERCPGPYWIVGPSEDHIQ